MGFNINKFQVLKDTIANLWDMEDDLLISDILDDTALMKKGSLNLTLEEVMIYVTRLSGEFIVELGKAAEGNKTSARRSRVYSLSIGDLLKEYRKLSIQENSK